MNQNDLLKNIATGNSKTNTPKPREVFADAQLSKAEQDLNNIPGNITGDDRYKMWKRSTRDWIPHPKNIEGMWKLEERAYPSSSFKQDTKNRINRELQALPSDTAKMDYFKREASRWPKWLQETYRPDIERERMLTENRNLELSRINNKLATEDILTSFISQGNLSFDRGVSQRVHSEDIYNALKYGFTSEITTNGEGRVSVPLGGELAPVYALNPEMFPAVDPQEEYILLNDTFKMIDDIITPYYSKEESDYKVVEKANKRMLYEKLDKLGEKFTDQHSNIILDYAETQSNPADVINTGLSSVVSNNINKESYNNNFDTALDFINKWKSLLSTLERRSKA